MKIKNWATDLDTKTTTQIENLSKLKFVNPYLAVMPDAHFGIGATVGSVVPTEGAIIPAAVGVDIGCGMSASKIEISLEQLIEKLPILRTLIESKIPVGQNLHKEVHPNAEKAVCEIPGTLASMEAVGNKALHQMGTLGSGNHFIEICKDEADGVWIMLHSGSRGLGNQLATKHIEKAKREMKAYFIDLPDPDLAFFVQGKKEFKDYITDLKFCQNYAKANRRYMMELILETFRNLFPENVIGESMVIDCHHNYTSMEHHHGKNLWITRKGAISAKAGQLGIIPGSMGTGSFIVEGLGNPDSFHSCSHGAGRVMSRNNARKKFSVEDLEQQTAGILCRKDKGVLDEIPGAYKDLNQVMENQKDLVKPLHRLTQLICIKG